MIYWMIGSMHNPIQPEIDYAHEVSSLFGASVVGDGEKITTGGECRNLIDQAKDVGGAVLISATIYEEELRKYAQMMSGCLFILVPFAVGRPTDFEAVEVAHFVYKHGVVHSDEMVIRTMRGLGDTVYQRAFIKEGFVDTPWPELFVDKPNVKCVEPRTQLRTQMKNAGGFTGWEDRPEGATEIQISYDGKAISIHRSIVKALESQLGGEFVFDLPSFGNTVVEGKYAVINPNTVRAEWMCPARNCKSDYIRIASDILKGKGYTVVGVADVSEGEEWLDGIPPKVDIDYYRGDLRITELIDLIHGAEVVVSSVGWTVPMCLAAKTKLICIGGGLGRYNNPTVITDPRMDLSRFHFIEPDEYCMCGDMNHKCDKTISDFESKFLEALN